MDNKYKTITNLIPESHYTEFDENECTVKA